MSAKRADAGMSLKNLRKIINIGVFTKDSGLF